MPPESNTSPGSAGKPAPQVLRPVDDKAIELARQLLRGTSTGSLAFIDPASGSPAASLVTVATTPAGAPLILISALSAHTRALRANPACGLLLCREGAGDPLAHPRISVQARARFLERDSAEAQNARRRFLNRHHKAALYADFPDFSLVALEPVGAALNGGFGKAYELASAQLVSGRAGNPAFDAAEQQTLETMNQHAIDTVRAIARAAGAPDSPDWRLTGIDPDGIDLIDRGRALRIALQPALTDPATMESRLRRLVDGDPAIT